MIRTLEQKIQKKKIHSPNHDHKIKEIIKRNSNMPVLKKVIKNISLI